ncbi:MAG: MerR family transcriptional regulator [Anaerolineae bacterium]|nr:MerR family transcriptional regulator [Anaerolineae bacterium]
MTKLMTIGELAKRVGLRPSALRYYEEQGLLAPDGRTESGYRLYSPTAEKTLRLIQRAQRLGLSLDDIRRLLAGYQSGTLSDETIIQVVEARAIALEQQLTELLVYQHELDLFLQDIRHEHGEPTTADHSGRDHVDKLLEHICLNPHQQTARNWLNWLIEAAGCQLHSQSGQVILKQLAGQHSHIWREEEGYHILMVNHDPAIGRALTDLTRLEADCDAPTHADLTAVTHHDTDGHHLIVRGANAFIYARLFLALEQQA